MSVNYDVSGVAMIDHPGEVFPQPEPGELELLQSLAKKLGYDLERKHRREKLKFYAQTILDEYDELSRVLTVDGGDGRTYFEFASLDFISAKVTQETLAVFVNQLPVFLEELEAREGITARIDLQFLPKSATAFTVRVRWIDGELKVAEENPS